MGLLVEGQWLEQPFEPQSPRINGGRFVRRPAGFRSWITPDGAPGPTGRGGFAAEPGRYHLYVSYACPWAHRTLIFRKLKKLEDIIGLSVVNPVMGASGWSFEPGDGVIGDSVNGAHYLYELYQKAAPGYSGRVTVPVLWDKRRSTIVSNESSEIIRMQNSAFDGLTGSRLDLYPEPLRSEIDALNQRIYSTVNNGVYKAGFATSQAAYEEAVKSLFETLEWLERRLSSRRYLTGGRLTEADWRLFTTLVRFDSVYHGHFKCNLKRLTDYPNLWAYTRELYQVPGVAELTRFDHIKTHYYQSHPSINPSGVVPLGPVLDFDAPQGREHLQEPRAVVNAAWAGLS